MKPAWAWATMIALVLAFVLDALMRMLRREACVTK